MELKNLIVYWRGGGYDGCIWEPNMGFFDRDGAWHPVISTGCGALDTKEDVEAGLRKEADPGVQDWKKSDIRTFPLEGTEHPLEWMCREVRIDYVARFADALVEAGYDIEMKCDCCGEWFSSEDLTFMDIVRQMEESGFYTGDGGIGTITTNIWCDDCREAAECPECYEIRNPSRVDLKDEHYWERQEVTKRFAYDTLGVCEFCWEHFQYDHDGRWDPASQEWKPSSPFRKIVKFLPNGIKVGQVLEHLKEAVEDGSTEWDRGFLTEMKKYAEWQTGEGAGRADVEVLLVKQILIPTSDDTNFLLKIPAKFAWGIARNLIGPVAREYFSNVYREFEPTDLTEYWKEIFNG